MGYIFRKVFQLLNYNKWISMLMIAEIALGMSAFTYSLNLFYSLSNEEMSRKEQKRDLVLEIVAEDEVEYFDDEALNIQDYEKLQDITDGKTFLYIALPQFYIIGEENCEFDLLLVDYKKLGLQKGYTYWVNDVQKFMNQNVNPIPELQTKKISKKLNSMKWKTEVEEFQLKNCILAPLTYMEMLQEEIYPGMIHTEWRTEDMENAEDMIKKVEQYLNSEHGNVYKYRVYSPEIELKNNAKNVKTSIQAINKASLLFLAMFFLGMTAIYQLHFEHREELYGISLAYGAKYWQLYGEMLLEILILNSIGTIIGIIMGYIATYCFDFGIMIGGIKVQGDCHTILFAVVLCAAISICVTTMIYRKMKDRNIVELLNNC